MYEQRIYIRYLSINLKYAPFQSHPTQITKNKKPNWCRFVPFWAIPIVGARSRSPQPKYGIRKYCRYVPTSTYRCYQCIISGWLGVLWQLRKREFKKAAVDANAKNKQKIFTHYLQRFHEHMIGLINDTAAKYCYVYLSLFWPSQFDVTDWIGQLLQHWYVVVVTLRPMVHYPRRAICFWNRC